MNLLRTAVVFLCVALCGSALAQTQDIDKELSDFAGRLSTTIRDHGKKKVAVLDFTDLQSAPEGELGKYIAEQLTVNLVMGKRDFSILDRANLRRILAEHKLTSQGLVDPENAKKLGQFAGVDALVLGTIIPKAASVSLTAKVIATDTAEIVGAARAEFKNDDAVKQLATAPAPNEPGVTPSLPPQKPFGELDAKVESFKLIPKDNIYGFATLTLIFTNKSPTQTYGVAILPDPYNNFQLSNARGDEFRATEVRGIEQAFEAGGGYRGAMTDIAPKSSILVTSKSQVRWNGKPGDYRPYRLETTVIFGEEKQGRHPDLRKYNLLLDVK